MILSGVVAAGRTVLALVGFAARRLRSNPIHALTTLLGLSLTVGVITAVPLYAEGMSTRLLREHLRASPGPLDLGVVIEHGEAQLPDDPTTSLAAYRRADRFPGRGRCHPSGRRAGGRRAAGAVRQPAPAVHLRRSGRAPARGRALGRAGRDHRAGREHSAVGRTRGHRPGLHAAPAVRCAGSAGGGGCRNGHARCRRPAGWGPGATALRRPAGTRHAAGGRRRRHRGALRTHRRAPRLLARGCRGAHGAHPIHAAGRIHRRTAGALSRGVASTAPGPRGVVRSAGRRRAAGVDRRPDE